MRRILDFGFLILDYAIRPSVNLKSKIKKFDAPALLAWSMLLMLSAPVALWACPGCKEALFDPSELPRRLAVAKGYALSIGLMLAVPLGLVGGGAALIARAHRRKQRAAGPAGGIDTPGLSR